MATIHSDHSFDLVEESVNRLLPKMLINVSLLNFDMVCSMTSFMYKALFDFLFFNFYFSTFCLLAFDNVACAYVLRVYEAYFVH